MTYYFALAVVILILTQTIDSANILILHPVVSRSHELVLVTLGEELSQRGHDVTIVRFKGRGLMKTDRVRSIFLEIDRNNREIPYMEKDGTVEPPQELMWKSSITYGTVPLDITVPICAACETLFENRHLINMTASGERYDVVIVDLLANECGLALANSWGVPAIAYWASVLHGGEILSYDAPYPASYVPGLITGLSDKMTFMERMLNFLFVTGGWVFSRYILLNPPYKVYSKYLDGAPMPEDLIKNISAVFVNSDWSLDFSRPILPNTVYVGCLWCRPARLLPPELEDFMQSAGEHGVIVFSLGATFNADVVPKQSVQAFLNAMGRLPQKVIMKMEGQVDAKLPPNVLRVKWMPQQDILGHNQTKAFISHCGMHGVMEAIYHSVPIVGMPIFADQPDVLSRLLSKGIAVGLDKWNLQEDIIYESIYKAIYDKSYKENMKKVTSIMKDSPQSAMDRAVFWTEHVIRTGGADHLKPASRHLSLVQYWLVDVLLALTLMFTIGCYLIYRGLRRLVFGRSAGVEKKEKSE